MQTTLLGLAIAIIVAVLAALVGPLFIDWSGYRSIFEAEASHLVGADVRVTGSIDARLLPSPRLTLNGVDIGKGAGAIHARSLGIEFALTPLLRAEWRATEVHLAGPEITLAVDREGHVRAPGISVSFDPDALSIERLSIEDGKVSFTDAANGGTFSLNKLWFNGEARSLLGPVKGEGAVTVGGELYPFRLSTGRYAEDDGLKLHVNVDPVNRALSIESDGVLTLNAGEPKFQGTLSLAKPVGMARRGKERLTQPWRVSGKLKLGTRSALLQDAEYQYGSEPQGVKLTGDADLKFGKDSRFDGVLSGRAIDLDRVLVSADGTPPPPAAAIRELIELGGGAFTPSIPVSLGIGIDQVTLGGSAIQNLRGDITSDAGGWNLDRFEFRAPGFTQVRLSGHLDVGSGVTFTGPAEIDANDPKVLAAWLEGRADAANTPVADLKPLSLRGDVTLGSAKIAVERLKATFDRKTISGQMAYVFASGNSPSKLDATVNAPELDIDAALGFGKALLAGSSIERPHDMTIAADIGRATVGGFVARDASARLKFDAGGLQIDKLAVADLGGAAFSASGRIVTTAPSPRGSVKVDLTAPDMAPVLALASRFAPATVHALSSGSAAMAPASLHAQLNIDGTPAVAKLGIDGSLGKVRVALKAQGHADLAAFTSGAVKLDGRLEADDGKTLLAMLGLDRIAQVDAGPGSLTLVADGAAGNGLRVDGRLIASGLDAKANGTVKPFADQPTASLRAVVARANLAPLRRADGGTTPLPVTFQGRIALGSAGVTVSDITATVAGANLRGKLGASLAAPYKLSGNIDADTIDGAGLIAVAIGMPATATATAASKDARWAWSAEPFTDGAFGDFAGSVALKVRRLDVSPQLAVREFRSALRFGDHALTLGDLAGDVGGGRLGGEVVYKDTDGGLTAQAKLSLSGSDASALLPAGARPPVTGTVDLSAEVSGSGLSPVALIGSLQGSGKITIANAQFAGLDPRAFDTVTRAVDQGLTIEPSRIANVVDKGLESGQLSVKRADGAFTISAGQIRLTTSTVESKDADLSLAGSVDLTDGSLDARLVLSGSTEAAGARPDIFMALKGPVAAPSRSIDVSALSGWLTLRAVEVQAKRLKAIEAAQPKPLPPPPAPPPAALPPAMAVPPISPAVEPTTGHIIVPPPPPPKKEPKKEKAPVLPAPIDILPVPSDRGRASGSSVGPEN